MLKNLILLAIFAISFKPGTQVDEMTMKAIYIERFSRFIEWPESMNNDFFRIQIIGDKSLAKKFRKAYKGLKIKKKSVLIHEHEPGYNKNFNPHIVYVTDKYKIPKIVSQIKNNPVLVISEGSGCAEKGAMINLFKQQAKLKFEINELALSGTPLYVSYRLKKAAQRIVNPVKRH